MERIGYQNIGTSNLQSNSIIFQPIGIHFEMWRLRVKIINFLWVADISNHSTYRLIFILFFRNMIKFELEIVQKILILFFILLVPAQIYLQNGYILLSSFLL